MRLLQGRLPTEQAAAARAHMDECVQCRELLAAAARSSLGWSREQAPEVASQLARYRVLEPVGAGAMGVVYAAYDPKLDRRVALKVLRGGGDAQGLAARLLREAQAMARLQHPNVIAVHDVGTLSDRVFLAMEFVDGVTLAQWLRKGPRGWREVRDVFGLAGKGLAAAHQAGLVHRDFKPENVLVGRDGRVRVTDFGLVSVAGESEEGKEPVGSPAYMAPEQMRGAAVDARADVFSFSVALYEALYGELPFAATTFDELRASVEAGRVREPPQGARVPGFLRRAVLRGLSPDRDQRPATMDELLADLQREPLQKYRRAALWVSAAFALLAIALLGSRVARERAQLCTGAQAQLHGAWDGERAEAVRASLQATGRSYAGAVFARTKALLDQYAQRWAAMHQDACQATRLRGEQSDLLLDLRMQCLHARRDELKALSSLLAKADAAVLDKAVQAADALTPVSRCADAAALTAVIKPPDAATERVAREVFAGLSHARALRNLGRAKQALAAATPLLERARALGYPPLLAEALDLHGDLLEGSGDFKGAERELHEAICAAEAAHDDRTAAHGWVELVLVVGDRQARTDEALLHAQHARAALSRLGGAPDLRASLMNNVGNTLYRKGRHQEALVALREAVALDEANGLESPLASGLNNLAVVLRELKRFDEALQAAEKSLAIKERLLGPQHPAVGVTLTNMGTTLAEQGRLPQALQYLQRALAIKENALGKEHPSVGIAWNNLGGVLRELGRHREALEDYRRALAIFEASYGRGHPMLAHPQTGIGQAQLELGQAAEAVAPLEQALTLRQTADADASELAETEFALARALWEAGRDRARSRTLAERARAALQADARSSRDLVAVEQWLSQR